MRPNLPSKLYYSIGEVSKAFGVNASLLRYWEKEFEVLTPKKNARGLRYYSPEDVQTIQQIFHLVKEKGYTLEGAREALHLSRQSINNPLELLGRLENVKAELVRLKYLLKSG